MKNLTPDNRPVAPAAQAISIKTPKQLYQELHKITALAAGIEAMAQRGIDDGELDPAQLENLGLLIARQREDLDALMVALHKAATGGQHD